MLLLPTSALAAPSGTGLAFANSQTLSVSISALAQGVRLSVCNGSADAATGLHATAADFGFTVAGTAQVDGDVLAPPGIVSADLQQTGPVSTLDAGACADVLLKTVNGAPTLDSGTFTGTVSVISKGEGIAQRQVAIAGVTSKQVAPTGISDTVNLKARRKDGLWSALTGNGEAVLSDGGKLRLHAPATGKSLLVKVECTDDEGGVGGKCPVGVVAHDQQTAQLIAAGDPGAASDGVVVLPLRIEGGSEVGDYVGTVDLPGGDDAAQAIKVQVSVTDGFWWTLVALIFGCGLAVLLQLIPRRWNAERKLDQRADALSTDYSEGERSFHEQAEEATRPKKPPFQHFGAPQGSISEYIKGVRAAVDRYKKSTVYFDTASDAYKEIDKTIATAHDDAACWDATGDGGLFGALSKVRFALNDLDERIAARGFMQRRAAIAAAAAKMLKGRTLAIGEAVTLRTQAIDLAKVLADWTAVAERVLVLQLWWRRLATAAAAQPPYRMSDADKELHARVGARLAQVKDELLSATDADRLAELRVERRMRRLYPHLAYLGARYGVHRPEPDAGDVELGGLWEQLGTDPHTKKMLRLPDAETRPTVAESIEGADDSAPLRPARPAELRDSLLVVGDVIVLALSVAVALVAALVTIGLGKNFGTLEDYLTVIVVGAAAQALVAAVLPSVNQLLGDLYGSILEAPAEPAKEAAAQG